MPLVSVIMAVYNGELYLAQAIDSVLSQTLTDFELLIVDDGSQDSSAKIIRSYQKRDSRIRFFQLETNRGISDARNRAIAEANSKYATIMDCDDICMPQRLEQQVAFLEAHPEIGLVGVSGRAVDKDLSPLFELNMQRNHCLIVLEMFIGVGLMFQTIMTSLAALTAVGGYAPGRRTGEERDLTWRLLTEGRLKFANLRDHLLIYRRHESSVSHSQQAGLQAERDEIRTRMLRQLWDEAPPDTLVRFRRLRLYRKLSWTERRAAKKDILRLIEALIAKDLVDAKDRPLLLAHMNRRLEGTMPRHWQICLHWCRYRISRLRSIAGSID